MSQETQYLNLPLSVIVHGPAACSMARHRERIAELVGVERIVDQWAPEDAGMEPNTVYLTHAEPPMLTELTHSVLVIPYIALAPALEEGSSLTDH